MARPPRPLMVRNVDGAKNATMVMVPGQLHALSKNMAKANRIKVRIPTMMSLIIELKSALATLNLSNKKLGF